MKNKLWIVVGAAALAGTLYAEHTYEKVAAAHDIMELVQKPNMDALGATMKAGGPQSDRDWRRAKAHASLLAESSQLLLMAGRIKDDVWEDGAKTVISAAKHQCRRPRPRTWTPGRPPPQGSAKAAAVATRFTSPRKRSSSQIVLVPNSQPLNLTHFNQSATCYFNGLSLVTLTGPITLSLC